MDRQTENMLKQEIRNYRDTIRAVGKRDEALRRQQHDAVTSYEAFTESRHEDQSYSEWLREQEELSEPTALKKAGDMEPDLTALGAKIDALRELIAKLKQKAALEQNADYLKWEWQRLEKQIATIRAQRAERGTP